MKLPKVKVRRIRALLLDVDGVLTDGGMYYSETGQEMKKFNTRDGRGVSMLLKNGIRVGLVTGESSKIVLRRAEKLRITDVYLEAEDKVKALEDFAKKYDLDPSEIAYMGDDVNDLGIMSKVGLAVAVADAHDSVKRIAHAVTTRKGGEGAVRELADSLLQAHVPRPPARAGGNSSEFA